MKIGVVIHASLRDRLFNESAIHRLQTLGEVHWTKSTSPLDSAGAEGFLKSCDVGVGSWNSPCPNVQILKSCPSLKYWVHAAGSVKHMFSPTLSERSIKIASCRGAIADSVAELTVGQMIVGLRQILQNAEANRKEITPKPKTLKTLLGSSVGIIGASEVGKRVMKHLRSFQCSIELFDPFVSEEKAEEWGVTLNNDLADLCASNDVVTIHTPLLASTTKLLKAEHFEAMRDDAVFINCSRGGCIDEQALICELKKGRLHAFIDVTDPEPAAVDSPLRKLPNVVLTSHLAGPASFHIGNHAVQAVADFIEGRDPADLITQDMLAVIA